MIKVPKILWLIVPGIVFVVILMLLLAILTKKPTTPEALQTENVVMPTVSETPSAGIAVTPVDILINKLTSLQVNDPLLVAPNFDRKISLPDEE